jgi:hypothetical protein
LFLFLPQFSFWIPVQISLSLFLFCALKTIVIISLQALFTDSDSFTKYLISNSILCCFPFRTLKISYPLLGFFFHLSFQSYMF